MKRLILSLAAVLIISVANSQSVKVQSAASYLRNGKLDKALENIEPTITHEKTMNDPKTWNYRGSIYIQIAASTNPDYQKLATNAVQTAYDSYQKSIELDTDKEFQQKNMIGLFACSEQFYNKGVESYNNKDYKGAVEFFEKTIVTGKQIGRAHV